MGSKEFLNRAIELVTEYVNEHLNKSDDIVFHSDNVYVVWYCYELGHSKALLSTNLPDQMYYEITYNSITREIFFDAYKKWESSTITT